MIGPQDNPMDQAIITLADEAREDRAEMLRTYWQHHIARNLDLIEQRLEPEESVELLLWLRTEIETRLMGRDSASVDERGDDE